MARSLRRGNGGNCRSSFQRLRSDALDNVEGRLGLELFVARQPDLPTLFTGPDLLASRTGTTIAFFLPKSSEAQHPRALLARLVLSRLALPPTTSTVLLLENRPNPLDAPLADLGASFTAVVPLSDLDTTSIIDLPSGTQRPVDPEVRAWHSERTAFLLAYSADPGSAKRLLNRTASPLLHGRRVRSGWINPPSTESSPRVTWQGDAYIAQVDPGRARLFDQLQRFLTPIVMATFGVDGEDLLIAHPSAGALQWPSGWPMPSLRELRRAAFAGWAVVPNLPLDAISTSINTWLSGRT